VIYTSSNNNNSIKDTRPFQEIMPYEGRHYPGHNGSSGCAYTMSIGRQVRA
jgi:hypothetical protein